MNVTDESTETPSYNPRLAANIRLAPQFVNRLSARLETAESMPDGVSGLLFGTSHDDVIVVQAFRSLMDSEIAAVETGQVSLDEAVRELARAAESDPGLAPLDVVGWFAFRTLGGLHEADMAFHNRQFQLAAHVALIVRRSDSGYLLFEFYTRGDKGLLTEKVHRWGAFRSSPAQALGGPVEIALRARAQKNISEEPKPEAARDDASDIRRRSRFSILKTTAEEPPSRSIQAPKTKQALITAGELPSVPAVISPPKRSGVPWLSSAVLFLIFAGGTFAFLLARGVPSSNPNSFWRAVLPDTGLNLRVEGQGDRVLLSWNRRNSTVRSAAGAVLHIDDGAQHRDVRLDAAQVENGAVLYRPNSDDVSFRLDVHGQDGASVVENLRVLDSAHANTQPLDLTAGNNTPATTETPSNPSLTTQTVHVWQPAPATSRVAVPQPVPPTPPLDAARPSPQRFDISRLTAPAIPNVNSPAAAIPPASSAMGTAPQTTPGSVPQADSTEPIDRAHETPAQTPRNTDAQAPADSSTPQNAPIGQNSLPSQTPPADTVPGAKSPAESSTGQLPATKPASPQPAPAPTSDNAFASRYVPPRPIRQVLPDISMLPAATIAATSQIDVIVTVDKSGRVLKAQVQQLGRRRPPRSMVLAAEVAAKQWVFEPARIDGRTVPSEHSIIFQFGGR